MSKRLVGYARVSTIDQSVDAQIDQLRVAGCVRVFADHGSSGVLTSRPELDKCLADLQPGDVLVVSRLDRLGRSAGHLATLIESLSARRVAFKSLSESIDTDSAAGRLILNLFASLASFERDLLRERTCAALAAKKRRGEILGRPRSMTPSQIAAARKLICDGESMSHVARVFKVDPSTLHRAFARETAAAGQAGAA